MIDAWGGGDEKGGQEVGDVFVIGGSSVYAAALEHPRTKRVLVTEIEEPEYECDTYFPVDLGGEEAKGREWRRRGEGELREFLGEGVLEGEGVERGEKGVRWVYCLFEREGA